VPEPDRPTDRALHALGPLYNRCTINSGGTGHWPPCPGADGREDDLTDQPTPDPASST
jgi:hypothetical protein